MIRKQKIAIAVTAALLIVGALVGSGITTGSLSSDAIGGGNVQPFICSAEALESEKTTYERYIVKLQQGEEVIARLANELTDLSNEQTSQEALLATTQTNIATLQSTKSSLESYIRRSCSNPRTPQQRSECSKKRSELAKVSKNLLAEQKNETKAKLKLKQIAQRTGQALSKVTTQETQMTSYRQYMATYDECEVTLNSFIRVGGLSFSKHDFTTSVSSNDGKNTIFTVTPYTNYNTTSDPAIIFKDGETGAIAKWNIVSSNGATKIHNLDFILRRTNENEYRSCLSAMQETRLSFAGKEFGGTLSEVVGEPININFDLSGEPLLLKENILYELSILVTFKNMPEFQSDKCHIEWNFSDEERIHFKDTDGFGPRGYFFQKNKGDNILCLIDPSFCDDVVDPPLPPAPKNYSNSTASCYDGTPYTDNSCTTAEASRASAEAFCQNHCSAGKRKKCGVNSWNLGQVCSGGSASVDISLRPLPVPYNAIVGSQDVDMLIFSVAAVGGDIRLKGLTVDGSSSSATFDNRIVRELRLYRDVISAETLLDTSNGGYISAEKLAFDGAIDVTIPMNSSKIFIITASLVDDAMQVGKTLQVGLNNIKFEDINSNPIIVNNLPTDLGGPVTLTASGNITVDSISDPELTFPKNILAGNTSPIIAGYKLIAKNEPVKIKDLTVRGIGENFVNAVSEVILYKSDKQTEIARKSVSSSNIEFSDVNYIVTEGSEDIYIKLVTRKIGKDEPGAQVDNLSLILSISSAEGVNSRKYVMPINDERRFTLFSVVPVRISNVALVSSALGTQLSSKLSSGTNNVAIIAVTTSSSDNTNSATGASLKTRLNFMTLKVEKSTTTKVARFTIEKISGSLPPIDENPTGTNWIEFGLEGADYEINNGSTVYYLIKALGVEKDISTDNDDFIKVGFHDMPHSSNDPISKPIFVKMYNVEGLSGTRISE